MTDLKRCKMCLNDPDKRVIEAERFDLSSQEGHATVLRHAVEDHMGSDALADVLSEITLTTPCAGCNEPFVSEVNISDGLVVRSYCDGCTEPDRVLELVCRSVPVDEVLPEITGEGLDQEVHREP